MHAPARSRRASVRAGRRRTTCPRAGDAAVAEARAHRPLMTSGLPPSTERAVVRPAAAAADRRRSVRRRSSDEQVAADRPKPRARARAPRVRSARPARRHADQLPVEVELVDVTAGRRVVAVDRRAPMYVTNTWPPTRRCRTARTTAGTPGRRTRRGVDAAPARVEDVDARVVKVGRVQPRRRRSRRRGRRSPCAAVVDRDLRARRPAGRDDRGPGADRAVLAREDEARRVAGARRRARGSRGRR